MKINQLLIKNAIPESWHKVWWIVAPLDYMTSLTRQKGDFFKAAIAYSDRPLYLVSDPQTLQRIFSNTRQFSSPGEWNNTLSPLLGRYSLVLLSGKEHQRQRKLLMPPFHGERVNTYGQLICNLTVQVMNRLSAGQPFVARNTMQDISLQIILQVVFGVYEGDRYQLLKQYLSAMLEIFNSPLKTSFLLFPRIQYDLGPWSPWGSFLRQRKEIDKLVYAEISERRGSDNSQRNDILSLLIDARDEAGELMTDQELRDELMSLMIAGYETTATTMAWALYWTHYLPKVGNKLRFELDSLGKNPHPIDVVKLPYLNAVCNETLRIYPAVMASLVRQVEKPVELMGQSLLVGDGLAASIYLLHQRPDIYPEPQKFKPERFLEKQFSPWEFMPFGAGIRRCIGSALALYELKLVVATILSNYRLELADKQPVKPKRRGLTLAPNGGVKMIMRERNIK